MTQPRKEREIPQPQSQPRSPYSHQQIFDGSRYLLLLYCGSLITGHQAQRTFTPIAVNAIALQPLNFLTFVTRLLRRLLALLRESEAFRFSSARGAFPDIISALAVPHKTLTSPFLRRFQAVSLRARKKHCTVKPNNPLIVQRFKPLLKGAPVLRWCRDCLA
jgi:hypothetical protein